MPPYFVYDGFEGDLDAGLVYERLLQHNDKENEMFSHLKSFLRACLSSHNAGDEKPYVDTTVFASTPAVQARRWAKNKFMGCFPGLHIVTPVKAVASPTTPPTDIAAILAAILPHRVTPPKELKSSHEDGDPKAGMAPKELEDTLVMCGQVSSATTKDLAGWFQDCMVKHTTN